MSRLPDRLKAQFNHKTTNSTANLDAKAAAETWSSRRGIEGQVRGQTPGRIAAKVTEMQPGETGSIVWIKTGQVTCQVAKIGPKAAVTLAGDEIGPAPAYYNYFYGQIW